MTRDDTSLKNSTIESNDVLDSHAGDATEEERRGAPKERRCREDLAVTTLCQVPASARGALSRFNSNRERIEEEKEGAKEDRNGKGI